MGQPVRRRVDGKAGIAVVFEGTGDLHYYAKSETAPARGLELKIEAKSDDLSFEKAVLPPWILFKDSAGHDIEVYVGNFTVFVPIRLPPARTQTKQVDKAEVEVKISGIACTSMLCLPPFEKTVRATIDLTTIDSWRQLGSEISTAGVGTTSGRSMYPTWFALCLAFLAGLSLNIMPCVWPVLPLVVMRIVEQAKQGKRGSLTMGLAFCLGVLLFFAVLGGANIALRMFYGTVLQWGDQFRSPDFVAAMALLLVVLALFMFGLFTIGLPSSIATGSGSRKGYVGATGMGFLAAILSTPCSFGILAAAFAWAQAQGLLLSTIAIMVIGIGMAVPYAVLTALPGLLGRLPRAGRWMELFKQAVGFVLLVIAVKLITALPETRRAGVLYFAVALAFCVWIWGTWVSFGTRASRKWIVRLLAIALAIVAGFVFLPAPGVELIDWQPYDGSVIIAALDHGRPVLVKFTADWCLSCKAVEKIVYGRRDVAELVEHKNVLTMKADTTESDYPATLALKNLYSEPGVPVSMLFVPGRKEPAKWRGILFVDELKESLQGLPDVKPKPDGLR